jgi:hypothetical protein
MIPGLIILGIFILLTFFGLLRNLFRRWELRESVMLAVALLIFGGMLVNPVNIANAFVFSIGGFLIPFILCIWLLFRAKGYEIVRTVFASVVIGLVSAALIYYFPLDNNITVIDAGVFIGVIAGGLAYLIGRTRRGAFISAALGVMLANVFMFFLYLIMGYTFAVVLGVGGLFSAEIIAAFSAAITAEVAGEALEYRKNKKTDVSFMGIDKFVNKSE